MQYKYAQRQWMGGVVTLSVSLVLATLAGAQTLPGNAQRSNVQNPNFQNPNFQNPNVQNPNVGSMATDSEAQAQRDRMVQQMRLQRREQQIRSALTSAGYTSQAVQNPVVAFAIGQDEAAQPLQEKSRRLQEALTGDGVSDAQVATLINDLKAGVEAEKERRDLARQVLDGQIQYSRQPRLIALLTTLGILSDDLPFINGTNNLVSLGSGTGGFNGAGFNGGNAPGGFGQGGYQQGGYRGN